MDAKVFLNGIDITQYCVELNDIANWALVFPPGPKYPSVDKKGELQKEYWYGDVRLEFK